MALNFSMRWPGVLLVLFPAIAVAADPKDDVVMRAMVDELDRAKSQLSLEGLPKSYFIQMKAEERQTHSLSASYGGLERSSKSHNRVASVRSRVGSYELDNTNFRASFWAAGVLPLDDDYKAIRNTLWLLLDQDYKRAVENIAQKVAYLKDKTVEDRADDFSPADPVTVTQPLDEPQFDRKTWEQNVIRLSARFKDHPKIKDARVTMYSGWVHKWLVNTDGTRLRTMDTGAQIQIQAQMQAPDGMPVNDSRLYVAERMDQLPTVDKIAADIDEMCKALVTVAESQVLKQYTGPVLFDPVAAGSVFDSLLSVGPTARPQPLGSGDDTDPTMEKKIGLRILPRSFSVYDDPGPKEFEGKVLAGAYEFDDEGVRPQRVNLVEKGILKTLVASRTPTRAIKHSTGHGRASGFGDPKANAACLYFSTDAPLSDAELKQELLQAARDEGLPFALHVKSVEEGQVGSIGDPILAFKVFVEDGHEEPARGMQFKPMEVRNLKRLLAAGSERKVFNTMSPVPASIISPAILFEELEVARIEGEFDKLPILPSPLVRGKGDPNHGS